MGCPSQQEISRAGGSHPLPTMDGISFGDASNMSGNHFSRGVSAQFGEAELRRLYLELNGAPARSKLQSYVCPARLPDFKITVALYYEGSYQERRVRLQMTPPLYKDDGRIESGIGYLFEQAVKRLNTGPPIDYGYRRPLDGSKLSPPPQVDEFVEPTGGDCGAVSPAVVEFLLKAAAADFHAHRPPDPVRFRDVRVGHVMTPGGEEQYMLCGQFLPGQQGGNAEWMPFATIKTSGYEQWIGAQAESFCRRPSLVWDKQDDLSSSLQSRLDSLR
jgi:hypothetical protein